MAENEGGWNEHAKLVLNELKRLNHRLDLLETQLDTKLDRTLDSFKEDHKLLETAVIKLQIEIAVIKKELAVKTAGIALLVSFGVTVISMILKNFV